MHRLFNFSSEEKNEKTIQKTWAEFRLQLANKFFLYSDIEAALHSTFLRVFNDLFEHGHQFFEKRVDDVLSKNTRIVRAARINPGDPMPSYDRFVPKAEYITNDNRFSPPGVEWLYLAFAPKASSVGLKNEEKCALKECRATAGETFALCEFKPEDKYCKELLIDLTIAKGKEFEDFNATLERRAQDIANREIINGYVSIITEGVVSRPQTDEIIPEFRKWAVYTYAKLLAEQIFLPITTEDRTIIYAPFQCMAQYFFTRGYCGIVYSSTVYPDGKNIVLFDKMAAQPYGTIKNIVIPTDI